jgi:large subunit ribosomal protein L9
MRIVFTKDIPKIAKKNDIKDVADGYGRFLLANGSAVLATGQVVQKVEVDKKRVKDLREKTAAEFKDLIYKLRDVTCIIEAKVSSGKHLFSGVRAEEIATAIEKQTGIVLNPKMLKLAKPIKETGEHIVAIDQGTMHGEMKIQVIEK